MQAFPKNAEAYHEVERKYRMKNEKQRNLMGEFNHLRDFMSRSMSATDMDIPPDSPLPPTREKAMRQSILHEREKEPGVFKANCTKLMKDLADGSLDIERRMPDHLGVVRVGEKQLRAREKQLRARYENENRRRQRELERTHPDWFRPRR